jgi:hypothetical protein
MTVDLDFKGARHWFGVTSYGSEDQLKSALRSDGVTEFPADTIARTETWSTTESHENGLGDPDCCGAMYLLQGADVDILAHEATHMALGILARAGYGPMQVTTSAAPAEEEYLAQLVGFITTELSKQLPSQNHMRTINML